jgi:hypothetical protein
MLEEEPWSFIHAKNVSIEIDDKAIKYSNRFFVKGTFKK